MQRALTQAGEPLPVVFLSGHGEVSDSVQAMKAGAVDFLTKSTDGSVLLEAVSRALARSTGRANQATAAPGAASSLRSPQPART